jgi:ABC-2 type transport system ATP-binding protein
VFLETENLVRKYGERAAVDGLSFSVPAGACFGVLGPNGCGKSTLFRILSTVERPTSGRVSLGGVDATARPRAARARTGVVFQASSLDRKLTAAENLIAQGNLYGLSGAPLRSRSEELLGRFGLAARAGELVEKLSGGQRRRVEIARALLHRPGLLLLDEASAGLDPAARREMWQALGEARRAEGVTVVFTTHLMEEAEQADRLLLMNGGRAVAEDTPARLKERIGGDVVWFRGCREGFAAALRGRFDAVVSELGGGVRVQTPAGHRFAAEALEAFPGSADSVEIHRPTLEDVFLDLTGTQLDG